MVRLAVSAHVPFAVIGGGIVGLAVASRLSRHGATVVLERHPNLISETSARNSGVVHAGIYYPDSLKADLCIRGADIIWDLHRRGFVQAQQCGKWIVATEEKEVDAVHKIASTMQRRGIPHRWVSSAEVRDKEPLVHSVATMESTRTGIIDVESFARHYEQLIETNQGIIQRNATVVGAEIAPTFVDLHVKEGGENSTIVRADRIVNCAGLRSPQVAALFSAADAALSQSGRPDGSHHLWVGRYATVSRPLVKRLVYPCPLPHLQGLGTHATIDMGGSVRFGPDAVYIQDVDPDKVPYNPLAFGGEQAFIESMHRGVVRFLPSVLQTDLKVGYMGIRPKLSSPSTGFKDFVIVPSTATTCVVHCFGIESPGLTSSAAIAEHVAATLQLPAHAEWYV